MSAHLFYFFQSILLWFAFATFLGLIIHAVEKKKKRSTLSVFIALYATTFLTGIFTLAEYALPAEGIASFHSLQVMAVTFLVAIYASPVLNGAINTQYNKLLALLSRQKARIYASQNNG